MTTAAAIVGAMPDMDKAFADIVAASAAKLAEMTDDDFAQAAFILDDEEPDDAA
jgi:hypothetical protein